MEVILQQGFDTFKGGGLTIPVLLLLFAAVMGWFPSHNAARRHHPQARRVSAASWCLVFVSTVIAIAGLLFSFVGPILVALWVAITTWSYGRTSALPKAKRGPAFEVLPARGAENPVVAENLASPAVGS